MENMLNMFNYTVTWHDVDRAGYAESGVQYCGSSRADALAAKKYCDETAMYGRITVEVVGRKEAVEEAENFYEEDFDDDLPWINKYSDGTLAYETCDDYERWVYEELMGHGKPVSCRPYNEISAKSIEYIPLEVKKFDASR